MKKTICILAIALFASCDQDPGDGVVALPDPPAPEINSVYVPLPPVEHEGFTVVTFQEIDLSAR